MKQKKLNEELNFDFPSFAFKPNENHGWRQQGFYLVCKTCELTHAVWVGPDKVLVGLNDDGTPKLKSRKSVFG